jgi:CBS-domain-containing membrane protein
MVRKLAYTVSEREHWISAAGGLIGMLAVWWISALLLDSQGAVLVATSMGSTAVMLFAAPHGPMSQPWPLIGGHLVSALVGVACVQWLGSEHMMAAPLAVGLSIAAMYSLRCLHPPGGATALGAVLGGESVHALGYLYVLSPILLNSLVILAVAVAFNYPFAWRRYPQIWFRQSIMGGTADTKAPGTDEKCMIPHSDLVYALSQIDTFVDISEEDLQRIYALALGHHRQEESGIAAKAAPVASVS